MKNVDSTFAFLDKLREHGVKRVRFDGDELREVEFFDDAPPPASASESSSTIPSPDGHLEDYEAALDQIRKRRFRKEVS